MDKIHITVYCSEVNKICSIYHRQKERKCDVVYLNQELKNLDYFWMNPIVLTLKILY